MIKLVLFSSSYFIFFKTESLYLILIDTKSLFFPANITGDAQGLYNFLIFPI